MPLITQKCKPCETGTQPLSGQEAEKMLAETPEWKLTPDGKKIQRTFKFKDFMSAMNFVQKVGELAELEGHHPDIGFGWGYCTVTLHTHSVKGLSQNDFILAAKINALP